MDLEDFNNLDLDVSDNSLGVLEEKSSVADVLQVIDNQWYSLASRRARWMDLLGDYAGSEFFLLDGESLLQQVLEDKLLHLGHEDDPGFQILHALYLLEVSLNKFVRQGANFELIFWTENRHTTLKTGCSPLAVSSRALSREILFRHLAKLNIVVSVFRDLSDPSWIAFAAEKKPMFVMINDGGRDYHGPYAQETRCCQRIFIYKLLSHGLAVALLNGAEYRDSQILTFVYEPRHGDKIISAKVLDDVLAISTKLDNDFRKMSKEKTSRDLSLTLSEETLSQFLERLVTAFHLRSDTYFPELLYLFVAHCFILPNISAQERARAMDPLHPGILELITKSFFPTLFFAATELMHSGMVEFDIDGRIFIALVNRVIRQDGCGIPEILGTSVYDKVQAVWTAARGFPLKFPVLSAEFPAQVIKDRIILRGSAPPVKLLPFEHPALADALSLVDIPQSSNDEHSRANVRDTVFSDTLHWHNSKKAIISGLGSEGSGASQPRDKRQEFKERRANQRFMATLQAHAATLTGAMGKALEQIVVTPGSSTAASKGRSSQNSHLRKKAVSSPKQKLTSKQLLLKEIADKRHANEAAANETWWRDQLNSMAKQTAQERRDHLGSLIRNQRTQKEPLATEVKMYRLQVEFSAWIEDPDKDSSDARDAYSVSILRIIKDIASSPSVSPGVAKCLVSALRSLGFPPDLVPFTVSAEERPLSFKFLKLVKSNSIPVHEFMINRDDPISWQLRHFGPYMDRSMDSAPDPRVNFAPDAWQRQVLDRIDDNESILVVAPTSAGKTFISFYAMEQVLRASDEGILVYVAPTKALVSQIAAEVYARFKKNVDEHCFWAIHTRDYRMNDPQKCQILVTVPEVLAIMLLSPPLAKLWTPRIRRIILDEIHSIGHQEGGAVWEQIILLAPCPIIGLSATIGSPEAFNTWLSSVQAAHGYKHSFIQHPHRYSHLRKYFYVLQVAPSTPFIGLQDYHETSRTRFLHPLSTLSFSTRSIPEDLALEAADTLSLYKSLQSVFPIDAVKHLDPIIFFTNHSGLLRQKDVIQYETALKAFLQPIIASTHVHDIIEKLNDPILSKFSAERLNQTPSRKSFLSNLVYLLSDLNANQSLPAILFNFDRTDCEIMAQDILDKLLAAENHWKETSPKWARKMQQWESWVANAKIRQRALDKSKKKQKHNSVKDDPTHDDPSWESTFDPTAPLPNFSFAGIRSGYTMDELDEEIKSLSRWKSTPAWALAALKRGIAVHHSGMNKRYRSLVESLFRQGFIRVIMATGTLALGINAPAKTSVFCGDSPFLTALMYRQCAGRAGRRGFDLLGNVVFYGIPMDRVQRLILSKLPSLASTFPLSTTLSLRLLNLLEGSENSEFAVKAVQSLLSLPRLSFGSDIGRHQLIHHLRFSIEYLRRERLLDPTGKPLNLFGIAAHLYYHEPSNLALVALIRSGVLHKICAQHSIADAKHDFILLMSHLFGRRYLPRSFASDDTISTMRRKYPSMIVLPHLPELAQQVLLDLNKDTLTLFNGYACQYATQYAQDLGRDGILPLSEVDYRRPPEQVIDSSFIAYLRRTSNRVIARSVFAANSGHDDEFRSVAELVHSARQGLHFNNTVIPSVAHITNATEGEHALNAYILDFFTHGQVESLVKANGIRRGDIWYLLQDFVLTLKTIRTTLEQIMGHGADSTLNFDSVDPAESETLLEDLNSKDSPTEEDDELDEGGDGREDWESTGFLRPKGVSLADWRLYEVVDASLVEFEGKFRSMWA